MRKLVLALALTAAAVAATAAAAAGPRARGLPDCLGKPKVRPAQVIFACADAGFLVRKLTWFGWGGKRAVGLGTATVNDCTPTCVAGHFHDYPAVLIVSGTQRCPGGARDYRTVSYAFFGRSPFPPMAPKNARQIFDCR